MELFVRNGEIKTREEVCEYGASSSRVTGKRKGCCSKGMAQTATLDIAQRSIDNALYLLRVFKTDGRKLVSELGEFCEIVPVGLDDKMRLL